MKCEVVVRDDEAYFLRNRLQSFPVDSWQHVLDEQGVDFGFDLFEFGVFGVQREGCWVGFAGFAGAAEEVEGEELHFFSFWIGRLFLLSFLVQGDEDSKIAVVWRGLVGD
jgi:hypothetical protein